MTAARTKKRSSSRAHVPCPMCAKRLAGEKGVIAHLQQTHAIDADAAEARFGLVAGRKR